MCKYTEREKSWVKKKHECIVGNPEPLQGSGSSNPAVTTWHLTHDSAEQKTIHGIRRQQGKVSSSQLCQDVQAEGAAQAFCQTKQHEHWNLLAFSFEILTHHFLSYHENEGYWTPGFFPEWSSSYLHFQLAKSTKRKERKAVIEVSNISFWNTGSRTP